MSSAALIVRNIPIENLTNETGESSDYERDRYLDSAEIKMMLKKWPIRFIIAKMGQPLKFVPEMECYSAWSMEYRDHLFDPPKGHVNLADKLDGYGYLASLWKKSEEDFVVLLEEYES